MWGRDGGLDRDQRAVPQIAPYGGCWTGWHLDAACAFGITVDTSVELVDDGIRYPYPDERTSSSMTMVTKSAVSSARVSTGGPS